MRVEPSAKDLKGAVRISPEDLETGDRVDVRGTKQEDIPANLSAKSVILMSGRDLAVTHQQQTAAWSKAISGRVTSVDAAAGKMMAEVRAAGATQSTTVQTGSSTEFSRYSADSGKAIPSALVQIQPGDQIKVVGIKNDDGSVITAERVYSGAFRTISVTVSSISADGKSIIAKDLATKKDVNIALAADASLHKLPPMMAMMMARRLNPSAAQPGNGGPGAVAQLQAAQARLVQTQMAQEELPQLVIRLSALQAPMPVCRPRLQ